VNVLESAKLILKKELMFFFWKIKTWTKFVLILRRNPINFDKF